MKICRSNVVNVVISRVVNIVEHCTGIRNEVIDSNGLELNVSIKSVQKCHCRSDKCK